MDQKATKTALAEAACGYTFQDRDILWEALQASGNGVTRAGSRSIPNGNKPLAMIGDPVIKALINTQSYEDGCSRGEMNNRLQDIESNANLARVGEAHGFENFINGNPSQRGRIQPRLYQDTVEALVAGAFIDGGINAAKTVMTTLGLL
ncbi:hypothetical protein EG328_006525 [Venturia inaequalis]|uniref:RNase III domain-containing protein n=1 Tax=Venturia inaequalis TaxID=5025 RepID=A0A8H3UXZ9_VENIN|nr:hypothetical protein EG328_006525 [Venturia inaequalis]KAE9979382.1 hypothetical protein EG327_007044 [Venturia inaequalis]